MKQKRKKLGRKLLGFLLALVLVVGLMPGMGMTVLADDADLELGEGSLESANQSRNLAVDANGVIHIVYQKTDGSIVYTKSTNSGVSFSDDVTVVNNGYECEVAVSSNGRVYVAYHNGSKGYVAYSDNGNNFTSVELSGSDGSSIHLATDGDYVYAIQQHGTGLYYSSDKGLTYQSHTGWNWYAYSDVHVDTSNHKVIVLKDNPSVVCRVSEDYGVNFTEEAPVKCNDQQIMVYYSTATVGSGYAYMSGQDGQIYKINYNDATATEKTVNASSVSTGRSLSSDENNNVIVGYVNDDGKVYYQLSTDGGTTFEEGIAVADATSANAAINIKTGDVLFLYSKDGKIMLHREIGVIKGNVNYINDSIEGLEPNTEYMVEVLGDNDTVTATYYISSNETGNIPFIGIDKDGNAYEDLAGKKIKITKAGTSDVSDPIDIEKRPTPEDAEQIIDENYAKPEDVAENEVLTTENSITIHPETGSKAKQSYKIFNADGTEIAGQDWVAVDENGDIVFSGLSEHTEYLIKAIVPATQTKPRSYESEGVKITTMGTIEVTNPTELSFVQDGLEHEFEITTTPADAKKEYSLLPEENYTEEIVKLKDPGRYTVYYKASKDNYRTVYGSFDVEIREAAPADIVAVAKDYNGVYDGKAHSIEIEVVAPQTGAAVSYGTKEGEYTLTANPSYTDVGTYKVFYRVTAEGRNEKTGSADIVIEKADSTVTTAPAAKTLTYNGQAQELVTAGTASGGTMKYAVTTANQEPAAEAYTFDNTSIPAKTAAGTYYVWYRVKGDSNHNDVAAASVTVTINKKLLTITAGAKSKVYGEKDPELTYDSTGLVEGDNITGSLTRDAGENAGTYAITQGTVTASDNYELSYVPALLTITKADSNTTAPTANELNYSGSAQELVTAGTPTGGTLVYSTDGESYNEMIPTGINAGEYTVYYKVIGDANHNDKVVQQVTVTILARTLDIKADEKSKTYGEDDPALTYTSEGLVEGDSITGALSRAEGENVGTYAIEQGTLTAGDNYIITYTGANLAITEAASSVTTEPVTKMPTYNGGKQTLVAGGEVAGGTMQYALGTDAEIAPTEGWSTSIPAETDAGTYYVWYRAVGDNNHSDVEATCVSVDIEKAAITITADDKSSQKGAELQELSWQVSGDYVSGDELGISASTTADSSADAGVYPITVSWNDNANYEATLISGKYTITAPEESGRVETKTIVADNVPSCSISNLTTELARSLATEEELIRVQNGENLLIYLDMENIDDSVSATDKSLVEAAVKASSKDAKVGMYLDLTLYKKVGDGAATKVTDTKESRISVTIEVPDSLKGGSDVTRTFYIIRVHDGATDILATTTETTITFETDKFSTYALAYSDKSNGSPSVTTPAQQEKAPKTGDNFPSVWLWALILAGGLVPVGYAGGRHKGLERK